MPAFFEDNRRFEPADAAARDKYGFRLFGWNELTFCFASNRRVAQAGDAGRIRVFKSVIATLVAADAVVDVLDGSRHCLVAKFRVGQLRPSHDEEVHLVVLQDLLGQFRRVDAPHADSRHAGLFADSCRVVNVERPWQVDGRNLVFEPGGEDVAAGNVEHVHAGFLRHFAKFNNFLDCKPALEIVVVRVNPHEQRHALRDAGADCANAFQREFCPVFKASAVFVRAVVDAAGEEGVRQVIVRAVEFHAVEPGLYGAPCRFAKAFRDFRDLFLRNAGNRHLWADRHVACHENLRGLIHAHGQAALPELQSGFPSGRVDGVRQPFEAGNILVLADG